ncbi:hypothetical protein CMV24_18975 [Pseudomonas plecoglossicida]|uniref:Nucleotidyl transferase AbiEii/AbiGii toxin family protein n=3 Tax=Pseudomonas TaxID=286 RepID=A0A2A3M1G4_PSEDL|nr:MULTISPECIES: hypothetical protein [Pseudomonas]MBA6060570.1 hypothetical protein [Pseudomonas juntendi]MCT8191191.1 hypothetical protein [Pseudomonas monteilii]PBJ93913.1 hypothetical protein CMV24_18975 [Pseudomonas plecoglossicida]PYD14455.1 hypothetical protein DND47_16365 [Pseudomonas syringae pv. syringae]RMQ20896.1 hypothetical protein ALQ08_200236 [Pseudomonas syringae pv. delphinii]TXG97270.1 MAG: hypothetical protein E6R08_07295 [Nevskiaceae bacterium]
MVSVKGLDIFGRHFRDFRDSYVLIGGVASALAMEDAGESFRATKDLDIVLVIEALDSHFVNRFWEFIKAGGYEIKQRGGDRPVFYRFQNPADETYPVMIELFSRAPDGLEHEENATLTPIPTDESVSSLSAILLDEDYYTLLRSGRHQSEELTYISADRLIPFKAKAWLDLSQRKANGEAVDSKNVRKHRNDVLALAGLLTGEVIELPASITADMALFLERLAVEEIDFKALKIRGDLKTIIGRIAESFGLQPTS